MSDDTEPKDFNLTFIVRHEIKTMNHSIKRGELPISMAPLLSPIIISSNSNKNMPLKMSS